VHLPQQLQQQQRRQCRPRSKGPMHARRSAVILAAATLGGGEDPNVAAERRWKDQVRLL